MAVRIGSEPEITIEIGPVVRSETKQIQEIGGFTFQFFTEVDGVLYESAEDGRAALRRYYEAYPAALAAHCKNYAGLIERPKQSK